MIRMFTAQEGKVWKSKKENWIGSDVLILGNNDSVDNYEQVDKPQENEQEQNV